MRCSAAPWCRRFRPPATAGAQTAGRRLPTPALAFAASRRKAGHAGGALNVVTGLARGGGRRASAPPDIDLISFTGSPGWARWCRRRPRSGCLRALELAARARRSPSKTPTWTARDAFIPEGDHAERGLQTRSAGSRLLVHGPSTKPSVARAELFWQPVCRHAGDGPRVWPLINAGAEGSRGRLHPARGGLRREAPSRRQGGRGRAPGRLPRAAHAVRPRCRATTLACEEVSARC